jgi:small subunit ribosomal protein S10e
MMIPKKNKILVYSYLFKEGCLVAPKDFYKPKHDEIDVPNIQVMQLMKSLKSRGLIAETFNWRWYYWYLNDEGVEYMRTYLHLPEEYVPQTHKKTAGATPARVGPSPGDKPEDEGRGRGFDGEYRRDRDEEGGKGKGKGGKGEGKGKGF